LQARFWTLLGKRRVLAQGLDQEFFLLIDDGVIDRRSAEIHSRHDWHLNPPYMHLNKAQSSRISPEHGKRST
jgi:hypothetical protein